MSNGCKPNNLGGIVDSNHVQTGGGQKSGNFANVIYECPLNQTRCASTFENFYCFVFFPGPRCTCLVRPAPRSALRWTNVPVPSLWRNILAVAGWVPLRSRDSSGSRQSPKSHGRSSGLFCGLLDSTTHQRRLRPRPRQPLN